VKFVIAAAAVIAMRLLARAKRRAAAGIGRDTMNADSHQADFCVYLTAVPMVIVAECAVRLAVV
jgi:hypothetical protein